MTTKQLPDTLSELIRLAVKDARGLDRRTYIPNYTTYYDWFGGSGDPYPAECSLCFAGAVIAGTLNAPHGDDESVVMTPLQYDSDTAKKLRALDCFRSEDYYNAFRLLGLDHNKDVDYKLYRMRAEQSQRRDMTMSVNLFYGWDEFDAFLSDMDKAADILEAHGF